jgi:hypothetical protein
MAEWKPIKGYEERYLVSDEGEVLSLPKVVNNGWRVSHRKEKLLKPGLRGNEYLLYKFVILSDEDGNSKKFSIHRLVAEAFLENENNYQEVNHIDKNTLNNNVSNLEWCNRKYNVEYSKNLRVEQYTLRGEKIAEYKSISYASQITGIGRRNINNALSGWSNTAGGYIWKYKDE